MSTPWHLWRMLAEPGQIAVWQADREEVTTVTDTELATLAAGQRGLLALPTEWLLISTACFPANQRRQWRRLLPFAVEERLAEPLDKVHCIGDWALGEQADGQRCLPVLAISHQRMQQLRTWLEASALQPEAILPDVLLLPWQPGQWTLWQSDDDRLLLRWGLGQGMACQPQQLSWILSVLLREESAPECLQARLRVDEDTLRSWLPTDWDAALELLPDAEDECWLAGSGAWPQLMGLNLLQGDYARRSAFDGLWPAWQVPVWTGLAAALIFWGMQAAAVWQGEKEISHLRAAQEELYRDLFPAAVNVADPYQQMQHHLQELIPATKQAGDVGLTLLLRLTPVFESLHTASLNSMQVRNKGLELTVVVPDVASLDRWQEQVKKLAGINMQVRSVTNRRDQVEARLSLSLEPTS